MFKKGPRVTPTPIAATMQITDHISPHEVECKANETRHHQFTIPVEWEYFWKINHTGSTTPDIRGLHPTTKRVTKLSCACGEETKR